MTRFAFATLFLVGCSSSTTTTESAPSPLAYDFTPHTEDVYLTAIANGGVERIVFANFAVGDAYPIGCTVSEMVEGCAVQTCVKKTPSAVTPIDLGPVTVTSPSLGTQALVRDEGSTWARVIQHGDYAPDELVRISSTGSAAIAAFDLQAKVPKLLTPESIGNCPKESDPMKPTTCALSDTAPVARWTGGGEVVMVSFVETLDLPETKSLVCAFDGTKGNGRIPASALAKLPRTGTYSVVIGSVGNSVASGRVRFLAQRINYGQPQLVKLPD